MALCFEDLIERYHDEMFAYLWRLLGTNARRDGAMDVEDLVQDVFMRAYRNFAALRPGANHRAWLYKIATNRAYTRLHQIKQRRDRLSSFTNSISDLGIPTDHPAERKSIEQRVRVLMRRLPAKQKACITLRYLQDLDYPEIARIVGCSEESARANVYQAICRLRMAMAE
jgi:RNA polymerase sigma-70 factor (ECF subfamily)